jgi:hypothetical protein
MFDLNAAFDANFFKGITWFPSHRFEMADELRRMSPDELGSVQHGNVKPRLGNPYAAHMGQTTLIRQPNQR